LELLDGGAVGVKALLRIFRPSRKLVLIIGGIALLGGVSGGAALYIGKDNILGPSRGDRERRRVHRRQPRHHQEAEEPDLDP
jgi:hypothetical protein